MTNTISLNLLSDRNQHIKQFVLNTQSLGIERVRLLLSAVINLIKQSYETFKDGVQLGDILDFPLFANYIKDISRTFPEALKEKDNLTPDEMRILTEEFTRTLLNIIELNTNVKDNYGIDATKRIISNLLSSIKTVQNSLKDGFQADDLKEIPGLIGCIVSIIWDSPAMVRELKDLTREEISILMGELCYLVFSLIKN